MVLVLLGTGRVTGSRLGLGAALRVVAVCVWGHGATVRFQKSFLFRIGRRNE